MEHLSLKLRKGKRLCGKGKLIDKLIYTLTVYYKLTNRNNCQIIPEIKKHFRQHFSTNKSVHENCPPTAFT